MLFLVDHRTYLEKDEATKIWIEDGIFVQRLASNEFGGEYKRSSKAYLTVLWLVSLWAAVTNSFQLAFRVFSKAAFWKAISSPKKFAKRVLTLWLLALWELGRSPKHISSIFVDRFSRFNHQAKWGAAGWKSLELFYNYWKAIQPQLNGNLEGQLTRYWIERMENRQAVTNRLKIAINLLVEALDKFAGVAEIRLLSVASGSAQAVIQAMLQRPKLKVKVVLIDSDQTALDEAKRCVERAGLGDRFSFVLGKTEILEVVCRDFHPHIVEMVGFLDYRPSKKAVELIGRIRSVLPVGGVFVTCNIAPNPEKIFLDWVLLWPMIYRSPRELGELLVGGGFRKEAVNLFYEPFMIHGIAVAVK